MPQDTAHPQYEVAKPFWRTMRDALAGTTAVKCAGEIYLPRLKGQSDPEYANYKLRALWYGATSRTAEGFLGMITRKPATITSPGVAADVLADCDLRGNSFESHVQATIWELLQVAWGGTLVDYSDEEARPYVTAYLAEDIINKQYLKIKGAWQLSRIMLHEVVSDYQPATGENAPDAYASPEYHQWREVYLEETSKGVYAAKVKVWRRKTQPNAATVSGISGAPSAPPVASNSTDFVLISELALTRRAVPLDFVPFEFHGLGTDKGCPSKPILLDLAEVNFSDYRNSADRENGLHVAGLPTPWAAGFTDDTNQTLALGVTKAWVTDEPTATCGFLEFTGAGLSSISDAQKEKREMMAALGARILDAPTKGVEAAKSIELKQSAESSVLTDLAASAEQSLSAVLRIMAWWAGTAPDLKSLRDTVFVAINKDLLGAKMDPTMLTALMTAYQSGAISFDTLFFNLTQGNMYSDGRTLEEEQNAIQEALPPALDMQQQQIDAQAAADKAAAEAGNQPPGAAPAPGAGGKPPAKKPTAKK